MARLTPEDKTLILADFHTGQYTQRDLALKYECSHVTIGKICKGLEPKNKDKVTKLIAIKTELAEQNYQEVTAVEKMVTERTAQLVFFQQSAMKNQKKANVLLESAEKLSEFRDHATITKTNKETVLGKEPETVINNANIQTNNTLEWELI